ncbi:MAG: nuclear transport factor 2 family protein [Solirubrobacterales bacterium]
MSPQNVEKARAFYPSRPINLAATFSEGDVASRLAEEFDEVFHRDFETVDPTGTVTARSLRGMSGYVEGFREWFSSWESWEVVAEDFIESGDKVLVVLEVTGRSRSDVEISQRAANVLTFRDGRVARVEIHLDLDAARRAAGVEPG